MSTARARPWAALAVAFCLALALLAQLPHLRDDAWEDEAATLMLFASGSPLDAFRDYRMTNNHMLFSATLAAWWARGESVTHARLLPAAVWMVSMALMVLAGRRMLGWPATVVGVGLWSGAALTAAFAIALRGYAFSWPWVLLLFCCAPAWVAHGSRTAGLAGAVAGALLLVILPTNGIALACCLLFALWHDKRHAARVRGAAWLRAAGLFVLAALGWLVYVPHRAQFAAHLESGFSTWSTMQIMAHWWLASTAPCLPLLPLLAWGAWRAWHAPRGDPARDALALLALLIVVPTCAVAASPVALVPRALVPLLPLWCLALGGLLAATAPAIVGTRAWTTPAVCAVLALAAFACGRVLPDCAGATWRFPRGDDLCHQAFREDYHPGPLLDAIAARYAGQPVLLPPRETFAFAFLQWNGSGGAARLFYPETWRALLGARRPSLVVGESPAAVREVLRGVTRESPREVSEVLRAGRLALYRCTWP